MARLIYASNMSLDGCTEDAHGAFDWAPPDMDVFRAIAAVMRETRTYLYGRRMYETMALWETEPALAAQSDLMRAFADTWQSATKVVYSTTLDTPTTARTRRERAFDPAAVRRMKDAATDDLLVGGPHLAGQAMRAGLVDECVLFVWPIVLGGRNPVFAPDVRLDLELCDQHRFANGVVQLRYRVR